MEQVDFPSSNILVVQISGSWGADDYLQRLQQLQEA